MKDASDRAVRTGRARFGGSTGALLALFVLVIAAALVVLGWEEAVAAVRQVSLLQVTALCAMASVHYVLRALRWHLIVRAYGLAVDLPRDLRHFFGGFAMTATPGRLGELVRLRWLHRETGTPFTRLLPVAFADRAVELASLLALVGGMLAFARLQSGAVWWLMAVATGLVLLACSPALLEAGLLGAWRLAGRRRVRTFVRARNLVRRLRPVTRPAVMMPMLLIGVVGWAVEGTAFWLLLGWLDVPLSIAVATAIFLVSVLAGALSPLPGGIGGTEATAIALLALQSVPLETAVVAVALIRLTTLWLAVLIGVAVFPIAEGRAASAMRGIPAELERS